MASRIGILSLVLVFSFSSSELSAITLLSQYEFNGDLTNAASPTAQNEMVAPDGAFKEGTDSAASTLGTPTFVTGVGGTSGSALFLDGIDDWVDITTDGHPGSQTGTDFLSFGPGLVSGTVMAWVKVDDPIINSQSRWLMGNANDQDFQSFQVGWNGGQLESVVRASDGPESQFRVEDATHNRDWADGEWHHLAISWDGQFGAGDIFIDGVSVGSTVNSGSSFSGANVQAPWEFPVAIGARNSFGTLNGFWQGAIDDLRIYADALSPAQIQTIVDDTPVAVTPDFDEDGDVDGNDFLTWQRGFGSGTTFAEGDANGTGAVDGADLALWEGQFGSVAAPAVAATAVPEPSAALLVLATAIMGLVRRW